MRCEILMSFRIVMYISRPAVSTHTVRRFRDISENVPPNAFDITEYKRTRWTLFCFSVYNWCRFGNKKNHSLTCLFSSELARGLIKSVQLGCCTLDFNVQWIIDVPFIQFIHLNRSNRGAIVYLLTALCRLKVFIALIITATRKTTTGCRLCYTVNACIVLHYSTSL